MNSQPRFTDYRGRPIRRVRSSRDLKPWQKMILGLMIVSGAPITLMAAVTAIDLASTQVKNILATGNGGTGTSSTLTGIVRGGSAYTAAELSGDVTTSGSNAATVVKINGSTITTNAAADQTIISTSSGVLAYKTVPDCQTGAIEYTQSTHAWSCGTVLTGTFSDGEIPSGTINGSTTAFTLAHTPSPAASLRCFLNGVEQRPAGADFTLSTATVTFGTAPTTGSTLDCSYRY